MSDNSKVIHDWQDKLKHSFDDEGKLYQYLFETMENFFYRYLETTENKNLKIFEIAPHIYGAESFESNMVDALKIKDPAAKAGIMELAKTVPKAQKPLVKYRLEARVHELTADKGHLTLSASINWDFPQFFDKSKMTKREVEFKYSDLGQFRKELALKLESACELFTI